jgi:uncharacterized protein YndB with AHSA1/START domain
MIKVQRRRAEVFEWFVREDLRRKWVEGLQSTTVGAQGRPTEGVTFHEVYDRDGVREERDWKVTNYAPGSSIAFETTIDGVPVQLEYTFKAHLSGKNTLVTVNYEAHWDGAWNKIIEPVNSARLRGQIGKDLEALKTAVDQSAAIF